LNLAQFTPNPDPRPMYSGTPSPRPPLLHPRRVRGGVKLTGGVVEGPVLWAGQRWLRVLEQAAPGAALVEGLEYAKQGQTKRITISPGKIEAAVQGRSDRPYVTLMQLNVHAEATWERVVSAMSEGAIYAAKLLAGELPSNIEDAFAPLDLKLFPADASELKVSCTCAEHRAQPERAEGDTTWPDARWCKHICCLAYLIAQRLATEPFLMFGLRGLEGRELLERLRERRMSVGAATGERSPIYVQHVAGLSDQHSPPLEESIAQFWEAGPELSNLDLPVTRPPVSHPILRRLGQSPFQAQFPLVGLLASCYDAISEEAIRRSLPRVEEPTENPDPAAG